MQQQFAQCFQFDKNILLLPTQPQHSKLIYSPEHQYRIYQCQNQYQYRYSSSSNKKFYLMPVESHDTAI